LGIVRNGVALKEPAMKLTEELKERISQKTGDLQKKGGEKLDSHMAAR
jgi:hypothetical protein